MCVNSEDAEIDWSESLVVEIYPMKHAPAGTEVGYSSGFLNMYKRHDTLISDTLDI